MPAPAPASEVLAALARAPAASASASAPVPALAPAPASVVALVASVVATGFSIPISVTVNTNDSSIYISDIDTNSVYKIDTCNKISRVAGSKNGQPSGTTLGINAKLGKPIYIYYDSVTGLNILDALTGNIHRLNTVTTLLRDHEEVFKLINHLPDHYIYNYSYKISQTGRFNGYYITNNKIYLFFLSSFPL